MLVSIGLQSNHLSWILAHFSFAAENDPDVSTLSVFCGNLVQKYQPLDLTPLWGSTEL